MIDINPLEHFTGKFYTDDEAAEVQQYLYKNAPTGTGWYWANRSGDEVVSTKILSAPKPTDKGLEKL